MISIIFSCLGPTASVTREFLDSIVANTRSDYELVGVHPRYNGKFDEETLELFKEHKVRGIFPNCNLGCPANFNMGQRFSRGDYLFVASNDIIVIPDWDLVLLEILKDESVGWISPHMCANEGDERYMIAKEAFLAGGYEKFLEDKTEPRFECCSWMYPRRVYAEVGELEERWTISGHEGDFVVRMVYLGWKVLRTYKTIIFHQVSITRRFMQATGGYNTIGNHGLTRSIQLRNTEKAVEIVRMGDGKYPELDEASLMSPKTTEIRKALK